MTDWIPLAEISPPIALGPLDGRYRGTVAGLVDHLSEPALNRERLHVEVEWFIHLCAVNAVPGTRVLTADETALLRAIPATFGADGIAEHAEIERETIHDVKAIEYYIKRRLVGTSLEGLSELVHFACTSEDINNLSYALMVQGAVTEVWLPAATSLTDQIAALAHETAGVAMLSRTHGQTATPTTVGKELAVLGAPAPSPVATRRCGRVFGQDQRRHGHVRRAHGRGARH